MVVFNNYKELLSMFGQGTFLALSWIYYGLALVVSCAVINDKNKFYDGFIENVVIYVLIKDIIAIVLVTISLIFLKKYTRFIDTKLGWIFSIIANILSIAVYLNILIQYRKSVTKETSGLVFVSLNLFVLPTLIIFIFFPFMILYAGLIKIATDVSEKDIQCSHYEEP